MKIFNKKVHTGIAIALVFFAGAVAYSLGYVMAMKKFNNMVSYNQEKENMYAQLSEIDRSIRQEYIGEIDENSIMSGICLGYIRGLENESCRYLSQDEYKKFISKKSFDENAVICEILDNDIAYIKINSVTPETGNMFANSLRSIFGEGIQKVVLDIRGLKSIDLKPIEKCFDSVMQKGELIKSLDKKGNSEVAYKADSDRLDIKFSIIIDSETEGTPELIASAAKDSGLGEIVGEKTRGLPFQYKSMALSDGSGIVYPIAHYVTQREGKITGKGVSPDVEIVLSDDKKETLRKGELSHNDDVQLQEAIKNLS